MTTWSDFYQGRLIPARATYEKYLLPEPAIVPSASHYLAAKNISWLLADFDDDVHHQRMEDMEKRTDRIDVVFERWHVEAICKLVKGQSNSQRLSTGDAMAGYLVQLCRSVMVNPPRTIQQCVGVSVHS